MSCKFSMPSKYYNLFKISLRVKRKKNSPATVFKYREKYNLIRHATAGRDIESRRVLLEEWRIN